MPLSVKISVPSPRKIKIKPMPHMLPISTLKGNRSVSALYKVEPIERGKTVASNYYCFQAADDAYIRILTANQSVTGFVQDWIEWTWSNSLKKLLLLLSRSRCVSGYWSRIAHERRFTIFYGQDQPKTVKAGYTQVGLKLVVQVQRTPDLEKIS